MSRYFISTANGVEVQDDEGVELLNHDALRTMLHQSLTEILRDEGDAHGVEEYTAKAFVEDGRLVMQARATFSVTESSRVQLKT
ncbi:hypothetical protein FV242_27360 [Methylobacterium sp. WL64]|uniref:DUF6894 family protein n=1 Tax=Methylobacterium sp. WL64 TaxID=2603894 RepID=UPI0011C6F52A|nr:hypothetical protein [Methylobacterium sp. WL64]TXM98879.1 hypothetical protein FV242_27360 [Methylobacterium sp. WL64]